MRKLINKEKLEWLLNDIDIKLEAASLEFNTSILKQNIEHSKELLEYMIANSGWSGELNEALIIRGLKKYIVYISNRLDLSMIRDNYFRE